MLIALLVCAAFDQASAQSFGSTYTSTAPKDCCRIGKPSELDGSTTSVCPGKAGLIVLIAEDDLHKVVSVGRNRTLAVAAPAAQVWFHPFITTEYTVKWRAEPTKPFAIIQRWHIADGADLDKQGRPNTKVMLALTRLPPGPVCHVAYVDVKANANANELARQAADQYARDFTQGRGARGKGEVKVIGTGGLAIELATR